MNKGLKETLNRGGISWLLQRISAIILFFLLVIHYITYHFITSGNPPQWENVVTKMQSPWFNLMQFLFLISALYHGFNGIWTITEDYIHQKFWRFIVFSAILLVGSGLFFVGTLTIFKVSNIHLGAFK